MKQQLLALCCLLLVAAAGEAGAASCRAGAAAAQGAQAGYNRDMGFASTEANSNMSWSDLAQQCVSGISGLSTISAFPSLDELVDKALSQVCQAARQQVSSAVGSVTGKVSDATGGMVSVSPSYTSSPSSSSILGKLWQ